MDSDKNFYDSSDSSQSEDSVQQNNQPPKKTYVMDSDHRLLLRTCKPLLNTRNAAVSVTLYIHKSYSLAASFLVGLKKKKKYRLSSVEIISFCDNSLSNRPIDLKIGLNVREGVVHVRKA